jgi:nitrate reductase gamma subunit
MIAFAIPYLAVATFVAGMLWRMATWSRVPVPFRIPLTCGQQDSLPGIRAAAVENPSTGFGVVARMALETLLFRSLFRNSRAELREGPRLVYREEKFLWAGALLFHGSLAWVLLGHLRFFVDPVRLGPANRFVDAGLIAGLIFLTGRRLCDPRLRYISMAVDYLPLILIAMVAGSGVLLRYGSHTDVTAVKKFALGIATFHPAPAGAVGILFYLHLCAACALVAYAPFSKLAHMVGFFFSPTRNLANNSRRVRHVNPWQAPAHPHTYQEWEDEFRDKMRHAGMPLEKE